MTLMARRTNGTGGVRKPWAARAIPAPGARIGSGVGVPPSPGPLRAIQFRYI